MTVAPTRETGRRPAPPETARAGARDTGSGRDGAAGGVASFRVREGGLAGGLGPAAEFGLAAELDPARMDAEWALLAADVEAEWARFFASPEEVSAARGDVDDLVGAEVMRQVRLAWDAADRMDSAGGIGAADGVGAADGIDTAGGIGVADRVDTAGGVDAADRTDTSGGVGAADRTDTSGGVGAADRTDTSGGVGAADRTDTAGGVGASVGAGVGGPGLREQLACLTGFRALLAGIDGVDAASAGADAGAAALDLSPAVLAGVPSDAPSPTGRGSIGPAAAGPAAAGAGAVEDAVRVDVLAALEALAGAVAAAQARVTMTFADSQVDGAAGRGASVVEAERGVAPQVGLARGFSASAAEKRIALARSLTSVLPHTMAALTDGRIGEAHALAVHAGSRCLSPEFRRVLDQRIAADLGTCTPRRLRKLVDRIAAELDAAAVAARHADAVRSRGVWTRPAPDGMCYLTILGPVHQIVGAYASVRGYATRVVAGHGGEEAEGRSLSQVMTDTAIARLAGLAAGQAQPVTVNLVMTPESLYGHARNPYTSDPSDPSDLGDPSSADGEPRTPGARAAAAAQGGYPWTDPTTAAGGLAAAAAAPARAKPANFAPFRGTPAATAPDPAPSNPDVTNSWGSPPTAEAATRERSGERGARPGQRAAPTTTGDTDAATPGQGGIPRPAGHAPGAGDRCAGVNTPARIVGHGHVPAPLARAWLLARCDDHPDDEMSDERPAGGTYRGIGEAADPEHPGDHHAASPPAMGRDPDDPPPGDTRPGTTTRPRHTHRDDDWQTQWDATPPPKSTAQAAQVWVRRAFTSPDGRDLVALETKARLFPPALRSLLILRDDTCRMPYCDAQIGHADHITPWTDGGTTTLTNGQGLSIRCNYTKDLAGFTTRVLTHAEIAAYARDSDDDHNPSDHNRSDRVPGHQAPSDQGLRDPRPGVRDRSDQTDTRHHRNRLVARSAGPDTHVTELRTPTGHVYLSAAPAAVTA